MTRTVSSSSTLPLTNTSFRILFLVAAAATLAVALAGCGGSGAKQFTINPDEPDAAQSDLALTTTTAGVTPFIASVQFTGQVLPEVSTVTFTIAAKPNTVSAPVSVTWAASALSSRGYLKSGVLNLPVFGLYSGYTNQVSFTVAFTDGSTQQFTQTIVAAKYTDATGVYLSPTVVQARAPGSTLSFNYFILKSSLVSPVIVDTDGEPRWIVPAAATPSSYFANGEFITGSNTGLAFASIQMDGTTAKLATSLPTPALNSFTHNIDPGPTGVLAEFNGTDDLGVSTDDTAAEILPLSTEAPLHTFDMADILSAYMTSQGDDPSTFVRPGSDWFHMNATTYDAADQSIILSSRENFLIKLDYATHDIVWIFGDPTKYWYSFPSLRAKALLLTDGGDYPVGQHAVSVTPEGYVMVFNDGQASENQPTGEPKGVQRDFSEVSAYSIDATAMTAKNVWNFDDNKALFSPLCGSSYDVGGSYMVDFATADDYAHAEVIGLGSDKSVAFDFQYTSPGVCSTAWNSIPIPLESLQID